MSLGEMVLEPSQDRWFPFFIVQFLILEQPPCAIQSQISVKFAACESIRRQHPAYLTVILTVTRAREVALTSEHCD